MKNNPYSHITPHLTEKNKIFYSPPNSGKEFDEKSVYFK
jgi:hypothetical protein